MNAAIILTVSSKVFVQHPMSFTRKSTSSKFSNFMLVTSTSDYSRRSLFSFSTLHFTFICARKIDGLYSLLHSPHLIDFAFLMISLYLTNLNFCISSSVSFSSKVLFSLDNLAFKSASDLYFFLSGSISLAFNATTSSSYVLFCYKTYCFEKESYSLSILFSTQSCPISFSWVRLMDCLSGYVLTESWVWKSTFIYESQISYSVHNIQAIWFKWSISRSLN